MCVLNCGFSFLAITRISFTRNQNMVQLLVRLGPGSERRAAGLIRCEETQTSSVALGRLSIQRKAGLEQNVFGGLVGLFAPVGLG